MFLIENTDKVKKFSYKLCQNKQDPGSRVYSGFIKTESGKMWAGNFKTSNLKSLEVIKESINKELSLIPVSVLLKHMEVL